MAKNLFSYFKEKGAIERTGGIARLIRMHHSNIDYWMTRNNKQIKKMAFKANYQAAMAGGEVVGQVANIATLGGVAFLTAGAIGTIIIPSVGLIVGGVGATVGLGSLICSSITNRDNSHKELSPYVWSLIDDVKPAIDIHTNSGARTKALNAAINLTKNADSQIKRMGTKYDKAFKEMEKFRKKYFQVIQPLSFVRLPNKMEQKVLEYYNEKFTNAKVISDEMWERATREDGQVFEYMRRLVHVGNYLQCYHIVSIVIFAEMSKTSSVDSGDILLKYCKNLTEGNRNYLKQWSEIIEKKDRNYEEWEKYYKNQHRKYTFTH